MCKDTFEICKDLLIDSEYLHSKEIEYLPNIYNIKQLGNPSFFNINDKKNENNL